MCVDMISLMHWEVQMTLCQVNFSKVDNLGFLKCSPHASLQLGLARESWQPDSTAQSIHFTQLFTTFPSTEAGFLSSMNVPHGLQICLRLHEKRSKLIPTRENQSPGKPDKPGMQVYTTRNHPCPGIEKPTVISHHFPR